MILLVRRSLRSGQRDTVSQLKRSGEDARLAERLLAAFIDLEAQHIEQRDKLRLALMKR